MEFTQTASERLTIIKADEELKRVNESKSKSEILLSEFKHWATIDPLSTDLNANLANRSGLAQLQKKVFKIKRTKDYDIGEAIQLIATSAQSAGYKIFGADNEYVPYVIIGYEDDDINTVINSESLQPTMLVPLHLFMQVSARVNSEEEQAIVLFAAQALKILNSGVCNQLELIIPTQSAVLFAARYQVTLEAAGFVLIQTMEGYKILFPNRGIYELPCQLVFAHSAAAVALLRANHVNQI